MKKTLVIEGQEFAFQYTQQAGGGVVIVVGDHSFEYRREGGFLLGPARRVLARAVRDHRGQRSHLQVGSRTLWVQEGLALSEGGGAKSPSYEAPMPGKVLAVLVAPGDRVTEGQPLLILEAMKMEHTLRAQRAGVVQSLFCSEGEQVEGQTPLLELEPEGGEGGDDA